MRLVFFLLVLANLVFFVWAQGYLGGQEEGREPQRLKEQLQPEKIKVAAPVAAPSADPAPQVCRRIDGLTAKDAEVLRQQFQSGGFVAEAQPASEASAYWVHIPALPGKAAADKKAGELRQLGVSDFHILQAEGGSFAISLGLFRDETSANEFLQGLNRKGVRSARIEARAKTPAAVRLEVHGAADALAKRLSELLTTLPAATATNCQ